MSTTTNSLLGLDHGTRVTIKAANSAGVKLRHGGQSGMVFDPSGVRAEDGGLRTTVQMDDGYDLEVENQNLVVAGWDWDRTEQVWRWMGVLRAE